MACPFSIRIRRFDETDLPEAIAIQDAIYAEFLRESPQAFASRLALAAPYCFVCDRGDDLLGYLLAHAWTSEAPPPVGAILDPGQTGDILFIHDLAVAGRARGLGIGRKLVDHAFHLARQNGLRAAELIAVEGAAAYWGAVGFSERATSPELAAKVAGYGAGARWMTRRL